MARFGANVVMDILRTHPMVIIGGILQQNPFFVPPDEFLRELRERAGQNSTGAGRSLFHQLRRLRRSAVQLMVRSPAASANSATESE